MFLNFTEKKKKVLLFSINIFLFIAILLLMSLSNSCKGVGTTDNGNLEDNEMKITSDNNKLIVGCDATNPPFEYMKDGNIEGFDIDIATEIAKRMDKEIDIVQIKGDSTYQIPEDSNLDMIISAITINKGKEGSIDFSIPYFVMEYMLITLSETDIKSKEDLEGETVGILKSEKDYLDEDYLLTYKIEEYDNVIPMLDDLKNKNIDGVLISLPLGVNLLAENEGIYSVLDNVKSNKEFGIVFSKGSVLKEEVDKIIEEIKKDGTCADIYDKWFPQG